MDAGLAARVRRAAAQLNYRHNMTASNLRRGDRRSFMIGLMLEDVSNPYSSGIYRAVEDVARERGVGVLAGSLDEDPARERELAATLVARRVDGLIIVPAGRDHSYLRDEQEMGTAVVFVDRPPVLLTADSVMADNQRRRDRRRPAPDQPRPPPHRLPGRPDLDRHRRRPLRRIPRRAARGTACPRDPSLVHGTTCTPPRPPRPPPRRC